MILNRCVVCLGFCLACCLIVTSWTWLAAVASPRDLGSLEAVASRSAEERPGLPGMVENGDDEDEGDDEGDEPPPMGQETACCTSSGCVDAVSPRLCEQRGGIPLGLCRTCDEVNCPDPACIGAEGSCIEPHDTPGCEGVYCCDQICANNPFCCEVAWDETCANTGCIGVPAKADCCMPDGRCLRSVTLPCPGSITTCAGDADGDGIDEACACRTGF